MARESIDQDPAPEAVRRITFVPFMPDGRCAFISENRGLRLPFGEVASGEHYFDAALRIPLETAGFRIQRFHPFAMDGDHLFAWVDGDRYGPGGSRTYTPQELTIGEPAKVVASLRERGEHDSAAIVEEATDSFHSQSDESYYADNLRYLERAYLRATTPEGGSGFGRDAVAWRNAREHIVDAIERDGTFLDLGCANGLLLESVVTWAAERDLQIEPYGVDLGSGLIEHAKRRLPQWADRFWVGNAINWDHPAGMRFDYVHTLFDFVPVARQGDLIRHLLRNVVAPGGRLIVSQYFGSNGSVLLTTDETLRELGFQPSGESEPAAPGFERRASTAWIDAGA